MSRDKWESKIKYDGVNVTHIRSMISLALFSFVFLGVEFFFDSRAAEVVDANSVLLYQSVILLASVVGFIIYAVLYRLLERKISEVVLIGLNIVEVAAATGILLGPEKWILICGIIFFVICGVTGGGVYYDISIVYKDRKHLTVTVGISYALGLLLQYINYNIISNMVVRLIIFVLAIVVLAAIFLQQIIIRDEKDSYKTDIYEKRICIEKSEQTGRKMGSDSNSIIVVLVVVVLLMTFIFSELDNIVTLVHAEGGADVGQWPRLFLAFSGVMAGLLFDINDQRFMNQMMYCVTVLSVIAMLVIEFGGAFIIGLIVFYLAAGFFVVYFTTGFINVSYGTRWPSFWTGAGRTVNNIGASIVGIISYIMIDTPGIMAMSIVVLVLLVLISIAVFVLENLQKRQYKRYDDEKVSELQDYQLEHQSEDHAERSKVDFQRFADTHHFTKREKEVMQKLLISDGSVQDIADELYISRTSLYRHLSSMNEKTGTRSRVGLIQYYYEWHEE